MAAEQSIEGRCPTCTTTVRGRGILIEYVRDGRTAAYAECPECGDVVRLD